MIHVPLLVRVKAVEGSLAIQWPEFNAIPPESRGGKPWYPFVMGNGAVAWDLVRRKGAVKLCLLVAPREFAREAHRLFGMKAEPLPLSLAKEFIEGRTRWATWQAFVAEYNLQFEDQ